MVNLGSDPTVKASPEVKQGSAGLSEQTLRVLRKVDEIISKEALNIPLSAISDAIKKTLRTAQGPAIPENQIPQPSLEQSLKRLAEGVDEALRKGAPSLEQRITPGEEKERKVQPEDLKRFLKDLKELIPRTDLDGLGQKIEQGAVQKIEKGQHEGSKLQDLERIIKQLQDYLGFPNEAGAITQEHEHNSPSSPDKEQNRQP